MKRRIIIAAALAALMTASTLGTSALAKTTTESKKTTASTSQSTSKKSDSKTHSKPEKISEPENAIGKDKAKAAALKAAGVSESKVEKIKTFVVKLDDGTVAYRVSFKYGEKYYAYKINALTGKVAEKKIMTAEEHEQFKKERGGNHNHGKPEAVSEHENAIGKDKAKSAALKAAGVSDSKVDKVRAFVVKLDDGTVAYRVSFKYGDKYYAYKINALTGKVAEKKIMTAEEHEQYKKERGGHGRHGMSKNENSSENKTADNSSKAS